MHLKYKECIQRYIRKNHKSDYNRVLKKIVTVHQKTKRLTKIDNIKDVYKHLADSLNLRSPLSITPKNYKTKKFKIAREYVLSIHPSIKKKCFEKRKKIARQIKNDYYIANTYIPVVPNKIVAKYVTQHSKHYVGFEKFLSNKSLINQTIFSLQNNKYIIKYLKHHNFPNDIKVLWLHNTNIRIVIKNDNQIQLWKSNTLYKFFKALLKSYSIIQINVIILTMSKDMLSITGAHKNCVIIFKKQKIIYHYEPHGIYKDNLSLAYKIVKQLYNIFSFLDDYTFSSFFLDTFHKNDAQSILKGEIKITKSLLATVRKKETLFKKYYKIGSLRLQDELPLCTVYSTYIGILLILNHTVKNKHRLIRMVIKDKSRYSKIYAFLYYYRILNNNKIRLLKVPKNLYINMPII
jgi:hypothetical protein